MDFDKLHEESKYGCGFYDVTYGICNLLRIISFYDTCTSTQCPMIYWLIAFYKGGIKEEMSEENIIIEPGFTWSTFEDAIPDEIKSNWKEDNGSMYKCPVHETLFNREEEPCWRCYNDYE